MTDTTFITPELLIELKKKILRESLIEKRNSIIESITKYTTELKKMETERIAIEELMTGI